MEKTKITAKELAEGLLYSVGKFSNRFYEDFGQHIQAVRGIKLDELQLVSLAREIYIINMWIVSKILSPDRKVLDELHKIYLLPHTNQNQIDQWIKQRETEKLKQVLKQDEIELSERYKKYYDEWDGGEKRNDKSNVFLAMTMLEYMFNKGQPDKRLINIDLQFRIIHHVYGMMNFIMDFRKKYEVVD